MVREIETGKIFKKEEKALREGMPMFAVGDYRGIHTAPEKGGYGAPGNDLTDIYPDDIYSISTFF